MWAPRVLFLENNDLEWFISSDKQSNFFISSKHWREPGATLSPRKSKSVLLLLFLSDVQLEYLHSNIINTWEDIFFKTLCYSNVGLTVIFHLWIFYVRFCTTFPYTVPSFSTSLLHVWLFLNTVLSDSIKLQTQINQIWKCCIKIPNTHTKKKSDVLPIYMFIVFIILLQ